MNCTGLLYCYFTYSAFLLRPGGPLKAEIHKVCCLPSGVTMTNHLGQKIDIASVLRGHHAILSFGTVHSAGTPNLLERVGRAAQTAKQKTGKFIVPVFISLDPGHDTAALNTAVGRAGSPDMMALTGPPDALLGCVERFKNTILAKVVAAEKSDVKFKKAADVRTDAGFASDHVYVVDEKGNFITIMPKELGSEEMGRYLVEEVQRSSEKG